MANNFNFKASIYLNDPPKITRPTLIDLNSEEYMQGLR